MNRTYKIGDYVLAYPDTYKYIGKIVAIDDFETYDRVHVYFGGIGVLLFPNLEGLTLVFPNLEGLTLVTLSNFEKALYFNE